MGCLNSKGQFEHWFGNIHLSGPCNRACYFCIGQHMMDVDHLNTLNTFPLPGLDNFINECLSRGVNEINMTGTNTDPMLFKYTKELRAYLDERIPNLVFGIRTNGVSSNLEQLKFYDKGSITICSLDEEVYKTMMGRGKPPNVQKLMDVTAHWTSRKINIVMGPENIDTGDIWKTLMALSSPDLQIDKINVREPYGQPHVGNPFRVPPFTTTLGNPTYKMLNTLITYWDVHYTEVESVNLYANARVSTTYPITKGYSGKGTVKDQSNFDAGRHNDQWVKVKVKELA